ncbi:MAG: hypothetical protein MZV63_58685 [Marinilabiliales bacterium]|nr:hypothetical protein [Marinilabiliales bacterium]
MASAPDRGRGQPAGATCRSSRASSSCTPTTTGTNCSMSSRAIWRCVFKDRTVEVEEGEIILVPRGVEHCPRTRPDEEVHVLVVEPLGTTHTGNVRDRRTVDTFPGSDRDPGGSIPRAGRRRGPGLREQRVGFFRRVC